MTHADLRAARKALGLTQTEFAARLGVHWTTVSRWENGRLPISKRVAMAVKGMMGWPER